MSLPRVQPMLASPTTSQGGRAPVALSSLREGEWLFQEKIDGVRAQLRWDGGQMTLTGRHGNDLTRQFPEITGCVKASPGPFSLDGEIHVPGKTLGQLMSRVKTQSWRTALDLGDAMPATFTAFDVLGTYDAPGWGYESLLDQPLDVRLRAVHHLVDQVDAYTRIHAVHTSASGQYLWNHVTTANGEGIVAKRITSRYLPGTRSWSWLKFKNTFTVKCIVSGPSGDRSNGVALAMLDGNTIVSVGSAGAGLTSSDIKAISGRLQKQKFPIVYIECLGMSADRKLRQPVVRGVEFNGDLLAADISQLDELPINT